MYPINLILDNKPCVVLGGGHVALRKVKGLLEAKAKVTVISPQIVEGLAKLVETKSIIWQKKVILNVVDRLEFCDFALPAKIRRGDLLVTFSTNGKSPALSRYLRCKMEREFDETYANWLDKLVQLRKEAIEKLPTSDDREIFWRSALSDDVMELVRAKKYDEAEASIRDAISGFRA